MHTAAARWHFPADVAFDAHVQQSGLSITAGLVELVLQITGADRWNHESTPDFISPAYGRRQLAPVLSVMVTFQDDCWLRMALKTTPQLSFESDTLWATSNVQTGKSKG